MKRIMPDTNIYELILQDLDIEQIRKAREDGVIVFYGIDIIRKELRSIPKDRRETVKNKLLKLRSVLLSIYDMMVRTHQYIADAKINALADDYYVAYAVLRGKVPKEDILTDFKIVAAASVHDIGILVSEDNKTMLSAKSRKAYSSVNGIHKLKNPAFIGFQTFKKLIGGVKLD